MVQALLHDWYAVSNPSPGVFALLEPLQVEQVLSYLVVGDDRALLIDSGTGAVSMRRAVETLTDRPIVFLNSHAHWDHVGNNCEFPEIAIHRLEAPGLAHRYTRADIEGFFGDAGLLGPLPNGRTLDAIEIGPSTPSRLLEGDEQFDLGGRVITVLHTPGHARGLLCLLDETNGVLFSTDTAYPGPLYAYDDDTDLTAYIQSMTRLAELAPALRFVHPSHNADTMPVNLLPQMRDALVEVANGRTPEALDSDRAIHEFDGFGIFGPLPGGRH